MNSRTEKLREDRKKRAVAYLRFTQCYKRDNTALFCFFEGEDSHYYGIRIKLIAQPKKYSYFTCGNKTEVLKTYRLISGQECYNNAKTAYFIDKDFDPSIDKNLSKIYETPCYSIENFYTSIDCFKEILRSGFNLDEDSEDFATLLNLYITRQTEFHQHIGLLNAYIACLKENKENLNLGGFNLNKLIKIDLDKIESNYTLETLKDKFNPDYHPSEDRINQKLNELRSQTCQKTFRGKFEIEFLRKFLEKLKEKGNHYSSQPLKAKFSLNLANVLSDLSQYADTPHCLKQYLETYKVTV